MKKILLTLVGIICSLGTMWATEAPVLSIETIAKDTTFTDVIRTYTNEGITLSCSATGWTGNLNGHSYIGLGSNASVYTDAYFSVAATTKITKVEFLIASNGNYPCTFGLVGWKSAATSKAADYTTTKTTTSESKSWDDAHWESFDLSAVSLKEVRLYRKLVAGAVTVDGKDCSQLGNGKTIDILGVKVYLEDASAPTLSASDVTIKATKSGVAATQTIDVTGANLTGSTLTATLSPAVSGLSVSLDKTAISNGAITAVATLSYQTTVNVAEGTTTLTLSDGTTSKDVTITYSAHVADYAMQSISAETTWDFSKTAVASDADESLKGDDGIKLTSEDSSKGTVATTPLPTDEVLYANATYITLTDGFDGKTISFKGTYPTRKSSYCQAGTLHFKTTVAGKVSVKFSDTGSSISSTATPRYLVVNGNQTVYWTSRPTSGDTKSNDTKTVEVPVAAGDVTITGSQDQCYYTVKFTPATVDVSKTLGTNGYSTFCSDYAFTATGADVYKATYSNTNSSVSLTKIDGAVPAGEGVILKGTEGATVTISPATSVAAAVEGNSLTGVASNATAFTTTGQNYVLSSNGTETAFVKIASTLDKMKGKAYLNVPASGAKSVIYIVDDATAINAVESVASDNTPAYNLAGQRVNASTKGIIIKKGRKFINK